jgi:predicted metal-dependent peptidase
MAGKNFDELRQELVKLAQDIEDPKDPRLNKFDDDFLELVELLMFSLIKDKDNFFGNIAIQLHRKIDYSYPAAAAVSFRGTYFDLILNPFLLLRWNLTEIKAVIVHECYHIMNEHIKRTLKFFGKYPRIVLNLGLDAAINQFIHGLPKGTVTLESLRNDWGVKRPLEKKREGEYYISELMKEYNTNQDFKDKMDKITQQEQGGGQGQQGQGGQGDQDDDQQGQGGGSGGDSINKDQKNSQMHDAWEESDTSQDMENMKDVVRSMANQAASQSRGKIPGEIQELIKKLNEKPILPWQDILRRYVGSVPVPYKKTITRRDRRQPKRLDLRGRLADHVAEIIIALDTSGSMSNQVIMYCMNEVFDIVKNTKAKVTIIECDMNIGRVYEAEKPSDVKTKVTGRGGTSFSPVFEYIKDKNLRRSILVYFTDGYGERQLSIKPVHFRTLWVLTGQNRDLSVNPPHGDVRELRLDEKWKKMQGK